jgi:uncharacterized membrane protein YfcA
VPDLSIPLWILVMASGLAGGFVKGAVGFALPMIMISALGSILTAEQALAGLILPTLAANGFQALRNGLGAAALSVRRHWRFVVIVMAVIGLSAQLVPVLPGRVLFLMLGLPVTLFALLQLAGLRLRVTQRSRPVAEVAMALAAGFIGGLSGVWGPPTVIYLTALDTPKVEQIRVQGIVFGFGAIVLTLAHMRSGVLTADTAPLSALLLVPVLAGLVLGVRMQDRLDQVRFRRLTLVVLALAGLNLVRRGLTG